MARPTGAVLRNSRIPPSSVRSCIASFPREPPNCSMERTVVISSASWVVRWRWPAWASRGADVGPRKDRSVFESSRRDDARPGRALRLDARGRWCRLRILVASYDGRPVKIEGNKAIPRATEARPRSRRRPSSISTIRIVVKRHRPTRAARGACPPTEGIHAFDKHFSDLARLKAKDSASSPKRPTRQASNACSVC